MSADPAPDWRSYTEEGGLYSSAEHFEAMQKLIVFSLNDEWFGLEVGSVREITPPMAAHWMPFVPRHIAGFIHLRGDIISVTNLKMVLGLAGESAANPRLVVIVEQDMATALMADGAVEVLDVPVSQMDGSFSSFGSEKEKWFKAKVQESSRFIAILDAAKLLESTRVKK